MNVIVFVAIFGVISLSIFIILYNPKESYLSLSQLGYNQHIQGIDHSIKVEPGDESMHAYDYRRHDYRKDKRRYNFLNHKNTLYNSS